MTVKFVDGPKLNNESIESGDTIVYINDHYDPALLNLLKTQYPDTLILQSFFCVYPQDFECVLWIPKFLTGQTQLNRQLVSNVETKSCFNFSIYKLRSLRNLALCLFEEKNYSTDYYTLNTELSKESPYRTASRVFENNKVAFYKGNDWDNFLAKNVYEPTAVSLITETLELEWGPCMTFTEKTVYSVLGLTFPIWLGGYQQAACWTKLGFDCFDDVINHDYQYETDPRVSMQQALADNDKILRDLDYASYVRKSMLQRLIQNRQRFLNHNFAKQISEILQNHCPQQANAIENFLKVCYP